MNSLKVQRLIAFGFVTFSMMLIGGVWLMMVGYGTEWNSVLVHFPIFVIALCLFIQIYLWAIDTLGRKA